MGLSSSARLEGLIAVLKVKRRLSIKHEQQASHLTHRSYLCRRLRSVSVLTKPYDLRLYAIRSLMALGRTHAAQLISDVLTDVSCTLLSGRGGDIETHFLEINSL